MLGLQLPAGARAPAHTFNPSELAELQASLLFAHRSIETQAQAGRAAVADKDVFGDSLVNNLWVLKADTTIPAQTVYYSAELDGDIVDRLDADGRVDMPALVGLATRRRSCHLTDFGPDVLNVYNRAAYSISGGAHEKESIFTNYEPITAAMAIYLHNISRGDDIRVLELCAGKNCGKRWATTSLVLPHSARWDVDLTDFSADQLPQVPSYGAIRFSRSSFDLLGSIPERPAANKYQAALIFYGIDSISFSGDVHLEQRQGKWFERVFRLAVPDWHPNRETVKAAFAGQDFSRLSCDDLRLLVIERGVRPYCLETQSFNREVARRASDGNLKSIAVPLGTVNMIADLFDNQMAAGGCLIVGDQGTIRPRGMAPFNRWAEACFRPIDFGLLGELLAKRGLVATTVDAVDFINTTIPEPIESLPDLLRSNYIMTVRRAYD